MLKHVVHIVTYRPNARQRFGKYIPARAKERANIGRLLLSDKSVNTPKTIRDNRKWCFPWGPPRGYITRSSKGAVVCCQKLRDGSISGDVNLM
jgi:hypothetical protein